jgi:hypothetical protein
MVTHMFKITYAVEQSAGAGFLVNPKQPKD